VSLPYTNTPPQRHCLILIKNSVQKLQTSARKTSSRTTETSTQEWHGGARYRGPSQVSCMESQPGLRCVRYFFCGTGAVSLKPWPRRSCSGFHRRSCSSFRRSCALSSSTCLFLLVSSSFFLSGQSKSFLFPTRYTVARRVLFHDRAYVVMDHGGALLAAQPRRRES
jgi:hypothetical protein